MEPIVCTACFQPPPLCGGCLQDGGGQAAAVGADLKLGPVEAEVSDFSGAKPVLSLNVPLIERSIVTFRQPVAVTPNRFGVIWFDEEPHIDEFFRLSALPSPLRQLVRTYFAEGGEPVVTEVLKYVSEHLGQLAKVALGDPDGPAHV